MSMLVARPLETVKNGDLFTELYLQYVEAARRATRSAPACFARKISQLSSFQSDWKWQRSLRGKNVSANVVIISSDAMIDAFPSNSVVRYGKYITVPSFSSIQTF